MNLTNSQEARLVRMQASMKMSELYARHWIAMATTGSTCRRKVSICTDDDRGSRLMTPEELTDDALEMAKSSIWAIHQTANNIALLLEGREDEIKPH